MLIILSAAKALNRMSDGYRIAKRFFLKINYFCKGYALSPIIIIFILMLTRKSNLSHIPYYSLVFVMIKLDVFT